MTDRAISEKSSEALDRLYNLLLATLTENAELITANPDNLRDLAEAWAVLNDSRRQKT